MEFTSPIHLKNVMHLFTDVCNGTDGVVVRSIGCEVEDGDHQPQLNVQHSFSGSTNTMMLSPIGVPLPLNNVEQYQKDRKGDMEKSAKLSMKSSIGVIDQVGPHFRCQVAISSTTCSRISSYEGLSPL